tara:strand:- start:431 stop:706 length:276 start_codon:yes stop_codon:yes gene_type:complete
MTNTSTRGALRTRYHGPTNYRGSRIIVTHPVNGKRYTYDWNYALDVSENHAAAAQEYLDKFHDHSDQIDGPGLCFDDDYFWAWKHGEEGAA